MLNIENNDIKNKHSEMTVKQLRNEIKQYKQKYCKPHSKLKKDSLKEYLNNINVSFGSEDTVKQLKLTIKSYKQKYCKPYSKLNKNSLKQYIKNIPVSKIVVKPVAKIVVKPVAKTVVKPVAKTIPITQFREAVLDENNKPSEVGLLIIKALEKELKGTVKYTPLGDILFIRASGGYETINHTEYPIITKTFDKYFSNLNKLYDRESHKESQSTYQRLADVYAVENKLPKVKATERPFGKAPKNTSWNSYYGKFN